MLAIEISTDCAAALLAMPEYERRVWRVCVAGDVETLTYAIGDSAEAVRAAYRERYVGDWIISVWKIAWTEERKPPCAWCARHGRYSH